MTAATRLTAPPAGRRPPTRNVRHWRYPASAAVVVLVAAITLMAWRSAHAGGSLYTDPGSAGTITLYDPAGHLITTGDVHDKPFVARAVSSWAAPDAYASGCKATLLAFQPREGVGANFWSGDTLTGSQPCGDPTRPATTATARDFALADFLAAFPARWAGRVQLRIYLGAPGAPTLTTSYATADLRITGDTWTLLGETPVGR